jgi:alginate O-acetyltransferase complex protein AlgI
MVFSSPRFLLFALALLAALAPAYSTQRKKQVLAVASCFFYAAWDYRYLALLLLVSVIDFFCATRIHETSDAPSRERWLWLSVASNLGILAYFKYTNFFIGTLNGLFGTEIPAANILLPAGISFYTFKSMSYTIDVYRREIEPVRSQLDYTTFITFFPELIAGPIVRASVFLPQMGRPIGPTTARLVLGANVFVLGLLKKKLIADRMASVADPIFASPGDYSTGTLWCGVLAYSIQIYTDFSGYSDMAIGTAKMLGYDLPENFNLPYASSSVAEFWRRWHMTLSSWLRDYLYVPLGGNRHGVRRTYANLITTMLLGGLWHGASWNFVLWGALHGAGLAVHRFAREATKRGPLPRWIGTPVTLLFVMLLWIPFRSPSIGATGAYLRGLCASRPGAARFFPEHVVWVTALVALAHVAYEYRGKRWFASLRRLLDCDLHDDAISGSYFVLRGRTFGSAFVVLLTLGTLFFFAETASSPFIYFQF